MMQNIGLGVDIENIERFQNLAENIQLLNKIFTENEIKYCSSKVNPAPHFAVRFAAKEAMIKASSAIFGYRLYYNEIEILNNDLGVPIVRIIKNGFSDLDVALSLSHNKDSAIAFIVVKRNGEHR